MKVVDVVATRCQVETSDRRQCSLFANAVISVAANRVPNPLVHTRGREAGFLVACCGEHARVAVLQRQQRLACLPDEMPQYVPGGRYRFVTNSDGEGLVHVVDETTLRDMSMAAPTWVSGECARWEDTSRGADGAGEIVVERYIGLVDDPEADAQHEVPTVQLGIDGTFCWFPVAVAERVADLVRSAGRWSPNLHDKPEGAGKDERTEHTV